MHILLITADSCKAPSFGYRMRAAFERLGHTVSHFNYRRFQLHRFAIGRALLASRLIAHTKSTHPDIAFAVKGETIMPDTIQALKRLGIHTVGWAMDDPFGTDNPANKLPAIPDYDTFFSFESSYVPQLKKVNPHSHYLPIAVDLSLHKEQLPFERRNEIYPVTFYGSHYPNRQQFFLQFADLPLNIVGFRWAEQTRNTPLASHVLPLKLNSDRSMEDLAKVCTLFNQTKINLNVHFTHSINSPNLRVFEIIATKSFQLCDDFSDLHKMFVPGKEIVLYKNVADCKEKIKYYLEHPEERKRIAQAGYRRILAEHTFDHRMKEALAYIAEDRKHRSK